MTAVLGQKTEELRQMGLHLVDVLAEVFDDGFSRRRRYLGSLSIWSRKVARFV